MSSTNTQYSVFFLYPKCVYWDGFPFILIQGTLSAASIWRSILCKPCFSPIGWQRTIEQPNYDLCMAKDSGDFIASWAFHIHEIQIGALHQALLPVFPLFHFWRGMKVILCESHVLMGRSSLPESPYFLSYAFVCLLLLLSLTYCTD